MKLLLKILFFIFLGSMITGLYLQYIDHPKYQIVMGLGILFLSSILMPLFIYYRYRKGKYKKYVIDPKSKNPFKINQKDL
ncbi:MAG: hypothetical protein OEW87_00015 [Flavobacteriaceae bacterium]|nr:hypothetical protein [Flavobacteriaceae bacterium]